MTTGGYYDRAAEYRDLIHDAGDGGRANQVYAFVRDRPRAYAI